jgi:hypothetical protein
MPNAENDIRNEPGFEGGTASGGQSFPRSFPPLPAPWANGLTLREQSSVSSVSSVVNSFSLSMRTSLQ